jgi:hypothetical protein
MLLPSSAYVLFELKAQEVKQKTPINKIISKEITRQAGILLNFIFTILIVTGINPDENSKNAGGKPADIKDRTAYFFIDITIQHFLSFFN